MSVLANDLFFILSLFPYVTPPSLIMITLYSTLHSHHLLPLSTLFQMFEDLFSGSGAEGSGLSSELYSGLGSGFSSGFISEAGIASGFGLDLGSAWVSGEVYCPGLLGKPANNKKAELQSKASVLRQHHLYLVSESILIF